MTDANKKKNAIMFEASGRVENDSRLVEFLYLLMRDGVAPIDTIENLVSEVEDTECGALFTNGWLANYAKYLASRLQPNSDRVEAEPKEAKR